MRPVGLYVFKLNIPKCEHLSAGLQHNCPWIPSSHIKKSVQTSECLILLCQNLSAHPHPQKWGWTDKWKPLGNIKRKTQLQLEAAYQIVSNKLFFMVVDLWKLHFDHEVLQCPAFFFFLLMSGKLSAVLIFWASLDCWVCEQWQILPAEISARTQLRMCVRYLGCRRSSLSSACVFIFFSAFGVSVSSFSLSSWTSLSADSTFLLWQLTLCFYFIWSWMCGKSRNGGFSYTQLCWFLSNLPLGLMHVLPEICLSSCRSSPPSPFPWFTKTLISSLFLYFFLSKDPILRSYLWASSGT